MRASWSRQVAVIASLASLLLAGAVPFAQADPEASRQSASQAFVGVAAVARPAIIGADGPELTQVETAQQRLGLSGKGMTICVIDTGVDVRHPTFGKGCPGGPQCRIAFGYDVETQGSDPTPTDWANAGGHGTHVSGVALGTFPQKLLDAQGQPLPYQRGVAFGAKLGAIRACTANSEFPYDYTRQALEKTVERSCDVTNLSLGGFYVTPSKQLAPAVASVLEADIVLTAAQGNDDGAAQLGARMFNVASPGAFKQVLAIGHVNNTVNPGAMLQLDRSIATPSGKRSKLFANQRADTRASVCAGDCEDVLHLPREVILIRMEVREGTGTDPKTVACDMDTVSRTPHAQSKHQVLLLEVPKACKQFQNSPEIWELLEGLKPVLVLITLPEEDDSHVGPMYYRNKQTPVLWLRAEDGAALAAAIAADPKTPIRLKDVPGAALVSVPEAYSGQPALTSALGPAYDLDMKPDVSAPGSLYSSLPNSTYQTWPGTSMAAPYMAGVVALWKEAMRKQGVTRPPGGWVAAAAAAFKNTARPLPYHGSGKLMWPPLKVGAGVVQAYNAVINKVVISPTELLVRTDTRSQRFQLTLENSGDANVTYKLAHKPAVSVSLARAWYGDGFDPSLPIADLLVGSKTITVPAGSKATLNVKIEVPDDLRASECIYGGYLMLTPMPDAPHPSAAQAPTHRKTVKMARSRGSGRLSVAALGMSEADAAPVPLVVPYQGSSKDYSTLGAPDSQALFVPMLPELDAENAKALAGKPSIFLCDMEGGKCNHNPQALSASLAQLKGLRLASTLLRPVQDVKFQVWSTEGRTHLGTSPSQGAGATAPPLRRTYLTASGWDGSYYPTPAAGGAKDDGGEAAGTPLTKLKPGRSYRLKVELWPVLAAGDRLAGRQLVQKPLVFELDTTLHVPQGADGDGHGDEEDVKSPTTERVEARVTTRRGSKGGRSSRGGKSGGSRRGGRNRSRSTAGVDVMVGAAVGASRQPQPQTAQQPPPQWQQQQQEPLELDEGLVEAEQHHADSQLLHARNKRPPYASLLL